MSLLTERFVREEVLFDHLVIWFNLGARERWRNITSLQTKSSKGNVVNIFSPKQNRATFIRVSFYVKSQRLVIDTQSRLPTLEKLFSILPCVLFVNTTKAETAIVTQATREIAVEIWVTFANRSRVGVFKLPYINSELWWHTNAKLITPIAWKTLELMTENLLLGSPFSSGGTCGPSMMTDVTIISIPIRARADARDSLWISR